MADADSESNLLQVEMGNKQPLYWRSELYTQALTDSDYDYPLPARMIAIQAAYITTTSGGVSTDRLIFPLSAFEYAALPDKTTAGSVTTYWYDRQITPIIYLWQPPDIASSTTQTLKLRILSQIQDVSLASGTTLDMPYRALDVFVAGLAYRLSRVYAPDKEPARKADYMEAWANFTLQDTEDSVPLYVQPNFTGYWRA